MTTAAILVLTCVLPVAKKDVPYLVLYVFWVCMGANLTRFANGNKKKKNARPHAVL